MKAKCRNAIGGMVLAMLTANMAGCQLFPYLVAQFAPPKKVKALYKPQSKKKFLVFVDDYYEVADYEPIKGELTEQLNQQLLERKIASETIRHERLLELVDATSHFNRLSVSEVGRKLGAETVLYVLIDKFSLKDSETTLLWRGNLQVTVRLVDAKAGRLWPQDRPEGYPVPAVKLPLTDDSSPTYAEKMSKTLAARMADRITKLFYDHRVSAKEERQDWAADFGD